VPFTSKASARVKSNWCGGRDEGEMTRENSKPEAFKAKAAVLGPRLAPEGLS